MQLFETIDRVHRIHRLIQQEATGTPDEFARRFNLKRRHLYNILDEFKDYGARIRYCRIRQSFVYENNFEVAVKISVTPLSGYEEENTLAGRIIRDFTPDPWKLPFPFIHPGLWL